MTTKEGKGDMFNPITVEIKQGSPLVFSGSNVDNQLLKKLFPKNKRKHQLPCCSQPFQKKTRENVHHSSMTDQTFKNPNNAQDYISKLDAAYFGSNKTVHTAVGNGVHCNDTEFKKMYSSTYFLKREALEVQIQRDRAMTLFYEKKLELLKQ